MPQIFYLPLRLEGTLQAWGNFSPWNHKTVAMVPSKGSVIGLVTQAMGDLTNVRLHMDLYRSLKMGVRQDRIGHIFKDFQTRGQTWNATRDEPFSSSGNGKGYKNSIITREYVTGACYLVVLSGTEEQLRNIQEALEYPKRTIFLGKLACLPNAPIIIDGIVDSPDLRSVLISHEDISSTCDDVRYYEAEIGMEEPVLPGEYGPELIRERPFYLRNEIIPCRRMVFGTKRKEEGKDVSE